jgi:small subunit ribosomal protein S3
MEQSKILTQKIKEFKIQEFVESSLKGVGLSTTKLVPTPLGDKIVISASRPGLIVGRKGQSIKKLTNMLKNKFKLENPQIEINEITNINLDPEIVSERIANSLERFGLSRFKGVGHKTMSDVMSAGALGIEIIISGKVPSSRAKRWRFYKGYLKKCGQVAIDGVKKAHKVAHLKTGAIGIVVKIMPPDIKLPDSIKFTKDEEEKVSTENLTETDKIKKANDESKESTKDKKETKSKDKKKTEKKDTDKDSKKEEKKKSKSKDKKESSEKKEEKVEEKNEE